MPRLGRTTPIGIIYNYGLNETPSISVNQASETDTALAVTHSKTVRVGQATETDTGRASTGLKTGHVGQASEQDTVFALAGTQTIIVGLASETDTVLTATRKKSYTVNQATETDTGLALVVAITSPSVIRLLASYDPVIYLSASCSPIVYLEASRVGTIAPIRKTDDWHIGEDQTFQWTSITAGVADNITGWTIGFKLGTSSTAATASLSKSASLTTPSDGVFRVAIAAADTASLTPAKYYYWVSRTDSGFNQVLAEGEAWLLGRSV